MLSCIRGKPTGVCARVECGAGVGGSQSGFGQRKHPAESRRQRCGPRPGGCPPGARVTCDRPFSRAELAPAPALSQPALSCGAELPCKRSRRGRSRACAPETAPGPVTLRFGPCLSSPRCHNLWGAPEMAVARRWEPGGLWVNGPDVAPQRRSSPGRCSMWRPGRPSTLADATQGRGGKQRCSAPARARALPTASSSPFAGKSRCTLGPPGPRSETAHPLTLQAPPPSLCPK